MHASSSSNSVIYIHNNNDTPLTDISYQTLSSGGIGELKLANDCKDIAAHASCALGFTTPLLSAPDVQGSGLLIATYRVNDKSASARQIINYSLIQNSDKQGLHASTDTTINSLANANGVIYLYNNQSKAEYNLTQLSINNPRLKVSNSSSKQLSGDQIVAV